MQFIDFKYQKKLNHLHSKNINKIINKSNFILGDEVENFENAELLDIRNLSDHEIMNLAPAAHKRVLCCHRGVRSLKVVEELRARGHENVFSLKGGVSTLS